MNETMFDLITESALDSEIRTAGALVESYAKAMTILENADAAAALDAFSIFQEAATEAADKKEDNKDKKDTPEEKKEKVNKGLVNSVKRLLKALASKFKRQEANDPNKLSAKDKAMAKKYGIIVDTTATETDAGPAGPSASDIAFTALSISLRLIRLIVPYVQEWRINKELDRLVNKCGKGEMVDKVLNSISVQPGGMISIRTNYNLSKVKSWFQKAYKYLQFESGNEKKLGDASSAKKMIRRNEKLYNLSSFEKWYTEVNNGVIGKIGELVAKAESIDESKITPEYAAAVKNISELYVDVWINGIGGLIRTVKEAIFELINDSESRLGLKYTLIGGKAKFVITGKKKEGLKQAALVDGNKSDDKKDEKPAEKKKDDKSDDKKDDESKE
jgi:hypothetical protein